MEDPLDDTGLVQQQLDQLSTIGRCEYEKTCALLVQLFDQSAQTYQELLQSATAIPVDVAVQEGVYLKRGSHLVVLSKQKAPRLRLVIGTVLEYYTVMSSESGRLVLVLLES